MSAPLSASDRYRLALTCRRCSLRSRRSIYTQGRPSPSKGTKAHWQESNTRTLLEILIEETNASNRPGGHLNKDGRKNMLHKFQARTGLPYTGDQLKNRVTALKNTYGKWKRLTDRATGLGIDPTTGTITADDQWWENMGREDPEILKWRKSPPPFLDLMHLCFAGTCATGNDTYYPSYCASRDPAAESGAAVEEHPREQFFPVTGSPNAGPSTHSFVRPNASPPPSRGDFQASKYRRLSENSKSSGDRMCDTLERISASIEKRDQRLAALMTQGSNVPDYRDAAQELLATNEEIVQDSKLFVHCLKVLDDPSRCRTYINHVNKLDTAAQILWFRMYHPH